MKRCAALLFIVLSLLGGPPAWGAPGDDAFTWSVTVTPAELPRGGSGTVEATLTVAADYIVYADMTDVSVGDTAAVQLGALERPTGKVKDDPFGSEPREIYTGRATFRLPFTVPEDATLGRQTLEVRTKHQGCSEIVCFFPAKATWPVEVQIVKAGGAAATTNSSAAAGGGTPLNGFAATLDRGLFVAFAAVFIGGVLTSLTPCVYPLIPITVSVFGAAGATSRRRAFGLSAVYVLGMAAMFSSLGVAAAASGKIFGQALSNPVFVGVVAGAFALFGLSMIGLFEIRLPSKWQTALTGAGKAGPAGAFVMGLVAGIVAAPCTGPVLGAVLAYVASTRNMLLGFSLLFTYALGIGMLFLALGTFAGLASRLPRSGPWMDAVKGVFGVVMFAMALYFLKEVVPPLGRLVNRTPQTMAWAAVLLAAGVVLGAFRGSFHGVALTAVLRKGSALVACTFGAYLVIGAVMLPSAPAEATDLAWQTDLDGALAEARAEHRPAMIDFYADWCVACKELDAHTFTDPAVAEQLGGFTLIRVDMTEDTPANTALQERFGIVGLPHVSFIGPDGTVRKDLTLTGFEEPAEFLPRLADAAGG